MRLPITEVLGRFSHSSENVSDRARLETNTAGIIERVEGYRDGRK